MKFKIQFAALVLSAAVLALAFNNCGKVSFRNDTPSRQKSETDDIIVGNPMRGASKLVMERVCGVITRCNSTVTASQCEDGVLRSSGIDYQLGLAKSAYRTYAELVQADLAGVVTASSAATNSCLSAIEKLSCSDSSVRNAYDSASADPFANLSLMIPTAAGSCPGMFNQPPERYEFYVATTGSDANDGSAEKPWATIRHAAKSLKIGPQGAVVHVAPGTYASAPQACENVTSVSCGITTSRSGTSDAPVIFMSDQQWGAKISSPGAYYVWQNRGNYVSIIGFEVVGDSASNGGIVNTGSNVRVIGNHIHDIPVTKGCETTDGGGGVVHVNYTTARDIDTIGNLIHDIGPMPANGLPAASYCEHAHAISYRAPGGKIQNNVIYRTSVWGILTWRFATQVDITNNLIFDSGRRDGAGGFVGGGILISASAEAPPIDNSTVSNNIVRNNAGSAIKVTSHSGPANVFANNILFANGKNLDVPAGVVATGTMLTDPLMVDFKLDGSGNYRLLSSSPAVNAGSSACAAGSGCMPSDDYTGFARPYGPGIDIGPFEWHP